LIWCIFTPNVYLTDSDYYCESFNLFKQWFTEPVESAYFYWADGEILKFTSYEWNTISCTPAEALSEIRKRGRDIKSCLFIIHNHLLPTGFSEGDRGFYDAMVNAGFRGMFLLYTDRGVFILRGQ